MWWGHRRPRSLRTITLLDGDGECASRDIAHLVGDRHGDVGVTKAEGVQVFRTSRLDQVLDGRAVVYNLHQRRGRRCRQLTVRIKSKRQVYRTIRHHRRGVGHLSVTIAVFTTHVLTVRIHIGIAVVAVGIVRDETRWLSTVQQPGPRIAEPVAGPSSNALCLNGGLPRGQTIQAA